MLQRDPLLFLYVKLYITSTIVVLSGKYNLLYTLRDSALCGRTRR